jgi:hypothetical protein
MSEPVIHGLFPTPITFSSIDREFTKQELEFFKKSSETTYKNEGNITSLNRYIVNEPEMATIKAEIETAVNYYMKQIVSAKPEVQAYITQSWLNFTSEKQWHHKHAHPNSFLSGVYYIDADEQNLDSTVPKTKDDYEISIQENVMNNFSNFFGRSYLEQVNVDHEDIVFQKKFSGPLRMRIADFGTKAEVYDNIVGPIMLEGSSMSEIMYFTKYVGNYNITKVGDKFVFENGKHAVALEKV